MTTWFACTIQYIKILENDKAKNISEQYLVDAVSFTDAEARIYRSLSSIITDFSITRVSKTGFAEVFNYEDSEKWFKCKVSYVDVDPFNGKEKRISKLMLVAAENPKDAYDRIQSQLSTMIVPYEITDINLSPIIEVIPYVAGEEELQTTLPTDTPKAKSTSTKATQADYEAAELEYVEEEEIIEEETTGEAENPEEPTLS